MTAIQLGMPKVVHYGEGNIFEETPFPKYAKEELKNEQLRANLRFVTHAIRNKRARVTAEVPDWQDLRNTGESVKNYVLANLPELLEQFERNFTAAGVRALGTQRHRGKPDCFGPDPRAGRGRNHQD